MRPGAAGGALASCSSASVAPGPAAAPPSGATAASDLTQPAHVMTSLPACCGSAPGHVPAVLHPAPAVKPPHHPGPPSCRPWAAAAVTAARQPCCRSRTRSYGPAQPSPAAAAARCVQCVGTAPLPSCRCPVPCLTGLRALSRAVPVPPGSVTACIRTAQYAHLWVHPAHGNSRRSNMVFAN